MGGNEMGTGMELDGRMSRTGTTHAGRTPLSLFYDVAVH
jgi:hypothetical protein